jgi:hypothetical protein
MTPETAVTLLCAFCLCNGAVFSVAAVVLGSWRSRLEHENETETTL